MFGSGGADVEGKGAGESSRRSIIDFPLVLTNIGDEVDNIEHLDEDESFDRCFSGFGIGIDATLIKEGRDGKNDKR